MDSVTLFLIVGICYKLRNLFVYFVQKKYVEMSVGWFLFGLSCKVLLKDFIYLLVQEFKVGLSIYTETEGP